MTATGTLKTGERYLTFTLGGEQYAIPLLRVREVIEMSEPTPVPQTPAYFKGIINLRGQVISVLDLRLRLSMPKSEVGPKTAIIILDLEAMSLGVIVDRINGVVSFQPADLSDAPDVTDGRPRVLSGIARRDKKLTLLLDLDAALAISELGHLISARAA